MSELEITPYQARKEWAKDLRMGEVMKNFIFLALLLLFSCDDVPVPNLDLSVEQVDLMVNKVDLVSNLDLASEDPSILREIVCSIPPKCCDVTTILKTALSTCTAINKRFFLDHVGQTCSGGYFSIFIRCD